jgi:hypothetical protein
LKASLAVGSANTSHVSALSAWMVILLVGVTSACDREAKAKRTTASVDQPAIGSSPPGSTRKSPDSSPYRDGDLIFQRSTSRQSEMVGALTRSRWTHMGVIFVERKGALVLEATSPVQRTRLDDWVARGVDRHYVVKRLRDRDRTFSPETIREMKALGDRWLGRPYDSKFRWEDDSLYCSELAHKLFDRAVHVRLGRIERARDMNLEDAKVERALAERFKPGEFNPNEPVVTPDSIFRDQQLVTVEEQ